MSYIEKLCLQRARLNEKKERLKGGREEGDEGKREGEEGKREEGERGSAGMMAGSRFRKHGA